MSYAAYKMMHWPTCIENCSSGFITHSISDFTPQLPPLQPYDLDSDWSTSNSTTKTTIGPVPNLVVSSANVIEVYVVRVQEGVVGNGINLKRGGVMNGVNGVSLELVCHYRLHGNVESMAVLSIGGGDNTRRRDSIILTFRDAKISVLEYDTKYMLYMQVHCIVLRVQIGNTLKEGESPLLEVQW